MVFRSLCCTFTIFTNHKTLEIFDSQPDLSCQQAHWMEFMSLFDARIVHIKGDDNSVADALSQLPTASMTDSTAVVNPAQTPYEYCPYDGDLASANVVLPATQKSPWLSIGCLVKPALPVAATLTISANHELKQSITDGYLTDSWCKKLIAAAPSMPSMQLQDGL